MAARPPVRLPSSVERLLAAVHVDWEPPLRQPPARRVVLATVLSLVGSLVADAILVAIGTHVFPSTRGFVHFRFSDYATLTVIGVLFACAGWPIVNRVTSTPRWLFFRLAIAVTVVLLVPDAWILLHGEPARAVMVLMAMHLAIALVTYNTLVYVAPAGRRRRAPAGHRSGTTRDELTGVAATGGPLSRTAAPAAVTRAAVSRGPTDTPDRRWVGGYDGRQHDAGSWATKGAPPVGAARPEGAVVDEMALAGAGDVHAGTVGEHAGVVGEVRPARQARRTAALGAATPAIPPAPPAVPPAPPAVPSHAAGRGFGDSPMGVATAMPQSSAPPPSRSTRSGATASNPVVPRPSAAMPPMPEPVRVGAAGSPPGALTAQPVASPPSPLTARRVIAGPVTAYPVTSNRATSRSPDDGDHAAAADRPASILDRTPSSVARPPARLSEPMSAVRVLPSPSDAGVAERMEGADGKRDPQARHARAPRQP